MIHLLFPVVFVEMVVILLLLFRTPLRKFLVMALDRAKRGRFPIVAKTVAATTFVIFLSTVNSVISVARREAEPGSVNGTDQVLMARHLLDASLMGVILFLGMIVDRLHHYIREIRLLRKAMISSKKHNRGYDDDKGLHRDDFRAMSAEIASLKNKVKALVSETGTEAEAEAEAVAETD